MKIAVLSDSPMIPTGYSNQMKQLAKHLHSKGHEIHWLANAYNGATLDSVRLEDGTEFNFKVYGEMGQTYFQATMSERLKKIGADRFIILLDTFMLYPWLLNIDMSPAKTFFWFPSDGGGCLPRGCENILKKVDVPVAMAEFGQKQVKDYYEINALHIPHGLDEKRFFRLDEEKRQELRKTWGLQDKFVIGVVARNQLRKNLDRTIKTMSIIRDIIPNAVLFMHCDPNDLANQTYGLSQLIQRYNLENRVVFSGMRPHEGFAWDKMNEIYNLMDVFYLSTSGEGFGIPLIEAMACEVPVVATNYTTTPEIVVKNKAGLAANLVGVEEVDLFTEKSQDYDVKTSNGTNTGSWDVERGIIDIKHAAKLIEQLYKDVELRQTLGANGRKAVLEKYTFDKVGAAWEEILK